MSDKTGGPAFPTIENIFAKSNNFNVMEKVGETHHQGMTLRDFFAAKGPLEIWKGSYQRPKLVELVSPLGLKHGGK